MKKILIISVILTIFLFISGCAVNPNCSSITFQNNTGADVTFRYGNNTLYTQKGGNTIVYLYQQTDDVVLSVENFTIEDVYHQYIHVDTDIDSINIRFNYQYNIVFRHGDIGYYLIVTPMYVGDDEDQENDEVLNYDN